MSKTYSTFLTLVGVPKITVGPKQMKVTCSFGGQIKTFNVSAFDTLDAKMKARQFYGVRLDQIKQVL